MSISTVTDQSGQPVGVGIFDVVGTVFSGWLSDRLIALQQEFEADELMITTMIHDHAARRRSYELLADAFALQGA